MDTIPASTPIADYCNGMQRHEIRVNHDYQRSEKVWPDAARSYLIETILIGMPLPKLYLHQITNLRNRETVKEIVDGQQRSMAICAYFNGEFALASNIELAEAAGLTYEDLPDDLQRAFVEYPLQYDLFVDTTEEEVREAFRRMNAYTYPLKPEEQRHALFQGPFKWFINRLSSQYAEGLQSIGSFTPKQLARMQDAKLVTEVSHALLYGITTTNKTTLQALYKSRDREFPEEPELERRLVRSLDWVIGAQDLHRSALVKPYLLYALLLALTHILDPVEVLLEAYDPQQPGRLSESATRNLLVLVDALENPEANEDYQEFIDASATGTNVAAKRIVRFQWLARALSQPEI
jgi:hypothetical protein